MRKFAGTFVFAAVTLCFAGFVAWSLHADTGRPVKQPAGISVVVYGGDGSDRWKSLDQGISQACSELGIEKPVLTAARADDPARQLALLRRELDGGAKGLIVAACDASLEAELERIGAEVPVVMAESGPGGSLPLVSADNTRMGRELAEWIAGEPGSVAVLAEGLSRSSIAERYEGFMTRMEELGKEVIVLQREDAQTDLMAFIASSLAVASPGIDILAVLGNDPLEVAAEAVPASMVRVRLYGIGCSDKVVHALDQGVVEGIIFQNEYAIGYIAAMTLAGEMGLAPPFAPVEIQYNAVTRGTMYEPEIERLLFPIVQ